MSPVQLLHSSRVMVTSFSWHLVNCLLIATTFVPAALSHNYVECTNAKPNLTALLTEPLVTYDSSHDHCDGYPRGMPDAKPSKVLSLASLAKASPGDVLSPRATPISLTTTRQFVWPMHESNVLTTHRACNWNQELPFCDPTPNLTSVKPGATIMIKVATNGHAHEYENGRVAGHHKIYLAGDSGTHITASNQLTDDRVIFMAAGSHD